MIRDWANVVSLRSNYRNREGFSASSRFDYKCVGSTFPSDALRASTDDDVPSNVHSFLPRHQSDTSMAEIAPIKVWVTCMILIKLMNRGIGRTNNDH